MHVANIGKLILQNIYNLCYVNKHFFDLPTYHNTQIFLA